MPKCLFCGPPIEKVCQAGYRQLLNNKSRLVLFAYFAGVNYHIMARIKLQVQLCAEYCCDDMHSNSVCSIVTIDTNNFKNTQ